MTASTIRAQVHQYIDEADDKLLEVVYQLLEAYRQHNATALTDEQQIKVLQRTESYKLGKVNGYALTDARKLVKEKLSISKRTII
ncbi:MAG: hypothetical protein ACK417_03820 [Bacteroidia bacterium]